MKLINIIHLKYKNNYILLTVKWNINFICAKLLCYKIINKNSVPVVVYLGHLSTWL